MQALALAVGLALWPAQPEAWTAPPEPLVPAADRRAERLLPPGVQRQPQGAPPIFRRFSSPPRRGDMRVRLFEFPVALRPQTDADAEVDENAGIGYEVGFQPFNRVFASLGVALGRQEWRATDPEVETVEVKQLDVHQSLNFWLGQHFLFSAGFGLGVLDSLVVNTDGTFEHTVVPYVPVRLGMGLVLWDKVFLTLRGAATPFFDDGHVAGHSRLLFGFGWSY